MGLRKKNEKKKKENKQLSVEEEHARKRGR